MIDSATILIIGSDLATLKFLGRYLHDAGARILLASSGKEGLIAAWRDRPDGIIIDPELPDLDGLELVRKLRHDRRTAHLPILALSGRSNPDEMLAALEAGYDEYILKRASAPMELLQALEKRLGTPPGEQTVLEADTSPRLSPLIVFASAKGGVGTSSLCANVGAMIADMYPDQRIAVVDQVLPIGSIASITGVADRPVNLITLSQKPPVEVTTSFLLDTLLRPGEWGVQVLPGAPDPEASNQLNIEHLPALYRTLRIAFDMVLVDIGRLISPRITQPLLDQANQVVVVLNTDPATVELTKVFLDFLDAKGLHRDRVFPIVNRTVSVQGLPRKAVETALGTDLPATIPYMQENFSLANTLHQPISFKFPHYTATIALREATAELVRRAQEVTPATA